MVGNMKKYIKHTFNFSKMDYHLYNENIFQSPIILYTIKLGYNYHWKPLRRFYLMRLFVTSFLLIIIKFEIMYPYFLFFQ